jgi:hypothetical protein
MIPGVEIGVDGHLLAGHGVQGKAGADFRDPACAFGNDDEIDDGEDGEHHHADGVVTADHKMAECFDHLAGRVTTRWPCSSTTRVEATLSAKPQQGGDQQHGGEYRKIQRPLAVDGRQQHHQR